MPRIPAPLVLALSAGAVALAMAVSVVWMREIDELARQAHYVAWFWGGSSALCVLVFIVLSASALNGVVDFHAIEAPLVRIAGEGAGFVAGVLASLFVLIIGYSAWWLAFWIRKR